MEGVRQVAPVSNAEGGGRLMLSKGIDAECGVLKLCVCVCVCRVVSYPRGLPVCHQGSGKERSSGRACSSTRTTCLRISTLSLSHPHSRSLLGIVRLRSDNGDKLFRAYGWKILFSRISLELETVIVCVLYFFFFFLPVCEFRAICSLLFPFFFFRVGRMMMRGMENPVLFSNLHTRYELGTKEKYWIAKIVSLARDGSTLHQYVNPRWKLITSNN